MRYRAAKTGFSTLCVVYLMSSTASFGQSQPVSAQAEEAEIGVATGNEDIVVTATRQEVPLSRVPVSVAAYSQQRLDVLGAKDFVQIARQTPGVYISQDNNNISIRGIASNAGAGTTGIYIDDTPIQSRSFGTLTTNGLPAIFDLERVEVLRGPQGTLFGAGSQGGTIRYLTPQPGLERFSVYARGEVAMTEMAEPTYEAGVAIGGPIVADKIGFRISAWNRREGGYIDAIDYNDGSITDKNSNWKNITVLRGALAFALTDNLLVTPSIQYQSRFANAADNYWEFYSDADKGRFQNGNPVGTPNRDRFLLPSLKIELDLGGARLISNTSYFRRNQRLVYDGSIYQLAITETRITPTSPVQGRILLPSGPVDSKIGFPDYRDVGEILNRQRNFTQEIRLQSDNPDAALTWVIGAFYSRNKQRNVESLFDPRFEDLYQNVLGFSLEEFFFPGAALNPDDSLYIGDLQTTDKQLAGFADVTWAVTDQLKLTGGLRVARNEFSFVTDTNFLGFVDVQTGQSRETPITPKASISFQATPKHLIYATAAKGYRVGGSNAPLLPDCNAALEELGLDGVPQQFDSDSVWSYELGAKGRSSDGRIRYEASAYRIDWKNIQQTNFLQACGLAYIDNLGKARVNGFDVQGSVRLFDNFTFELAAGYTDAKFSADVFRSLEPGSTLAVRKGDALAGVAPWTVVVGGTADFQVAGHAAYARFNYEFSSKQKRTIVQNPATDNYDPDIPSMPATHLVRVRTGIALDRLNVSAFVDNLLNASPRLTRTHFARGSLLYYNSTFRPRTAGVTVTYRY